MAKNYLPDLCQMPKILSILWPDAHQHTLILDDPRKKCYVAWQNTSQHSTTKTVPSGNLIYLLNMTNYSGFSHQKIVNFCSYLKLPEGISGSEVRVKSLIALRIQSHTLYGGLYNLVSFPSLGVSRRNPTLSLWTD